MCPLQHLQVPTLSSMYTCPPIPGAAIAMCPLQHLQVPTLSSMYTCPPIPGAAIAMCPLQHLQVPTLSSSFTYSCFSQQTFISTQQPLQHSQLATKCCHLNNTSMLLVDVTPSAQHPLEQLQLSMPCHHTCI
eukprot:TRINITY_DN2335_c0_g2_i3.p2 TRINITY_DN2335_c0_g2~~TRINITY_DN2335_c0_g2_i3.p2  ORF type:complete len:132 (+),score=7.90 TRINITY_DN2335_c0_g2_i3:1-396(+)